MMVSVFLLVLLSLSLSACSPALPTPGQAPTQDQTVIAVAAEATVTAMAAANPPASTATVSIPTQVPVTVTPEPVVTQPGQFWITYLLRRRLAVMSGDGAQHSLLTNTPGFDYRPVWSPDGNNLAFLRFDGTNLQDGIIHILPAGSDTPRLVDSPNRYNYLIWMPDNRTLLATRNNPGTYDIYLVDTISGQVKQIGQNATEYPRLSPDGKKILLLLNSGDSCSGKGCTYPNDLYLYDTASGQTTRLSGDGQPKMVLGWAPDGKTITFWLADLPSVTYQMITPDGAPAGSAVEPPWWANGWVQSPDGSQIAFAKNDTTNGAAEVYVRPTGEGDSRLVARVSQTSDSMAYVDTLRWRPDGSGLVFNSWIDVYTVNLDGSGLRALPVKLENVFFDVRPSAGAFTPPPEPTAPAAWKICPGGLDSRLDIGMQAQVSSNPPTPNNVRVGPFKVSDIVGQIQPGEKVEIIGGPACDEGAVWWEIRSLSSGLRGYTLEGDKKTYWLEPVK